MNEIDCKIVLEEYVLLHEAYENQEFKRPLLELEYGGASACEEGKALLNQAKTITSQPLQVSKWNKDTQALLATVGFGEHGRRGRAAQKRRKVESECWVHSGFRAQIGHLDDGPMWVNGKTADLAKKIKSRRDAPGRS